jgi:methyl-accepting chemotaxis protein
MSKWTIGKKLGISFGAMLVLLVVTSVASLNAISALKSSFDTATEKTAKKIALAGTVDTATSDMLASQRGFIVRSFANDKAYMASELLDFNRNAEKVNAAILEIKPLLSTEEGKRILEGLSSSVAQWVTNFAEVERRCNSGDTSGGLSYATANIVPLFKKAGEASDRLVAEQQQLLRNDVADAATLKARSTWIAMALIGLGVCVGFLALREVRGISGSLRILSGEMSNSAVQVASAAAQVSSVSQELARGASEQAASLEETSASSEQISATAKMNAENSQSAADMVQEAGAQIAEANERLSEMLASMKEIDNSSSKISKIIRVIDEIAFQTNILALNAAVEAARAGEAGMGFAVVADEVRNLAQRCSQAAKDTADLIEASIGQTANGSAKLDQVASAVSNVTQTSQRIGALIAQVSTGSKEQTQGMAQVAKAIAEMEQVTQRSAASAEEGAAAAEEMSAQSEQMKAAVEGLKSMVGGGETASNAEGVSKTRQGVLANGLDRLRGQTPFVGKLASKTKGLGALASAVGRGARRHIDREQEAVAAFPLDDEV